MSYIYVRDLRDSFMTSRTGTKMTLHQVKI